MVGLQYADNTFPPPLSSAAGSNSAVGTYTITPSLVDTNNLRTNYSVIPVNGLLTISPLPPPATYIEALHLYDPGGIPGFGSANGARCPVQLSTPAWRAGPCAQWPWPTPITTSFAKSRPPNARRGQHKRCQPGNTGSSDGVGAAAEFDYPSGLAVDSGGNVFNGGHISPDGAE